MVRKCLSMGDNGNDRKCARLGLFRESTRGARDLSRRNVRGRQGADNTSQRPAHDRPCGLKSALPSRSARSSACLAAPHGGSLTPQRSERRGSNSALFAAEDCYSLPSPPPSLLRPSMRAIRGKNRAMTMLPTMTARKTIMIGSNSEVMAATALSTSSS